MSSKPRLHFAMMCNRSNGGFESGLTLIDGLSDSFDIHAWSLLGSLYPGHAELFARRRVPLKLANPVAQIESGEHVLFYMNDYPQHFSNFSDYWQQEIPKAASVQVAFNRTVGAMPLEHWLADYVNRIYFQDSVMRDNWLKLTADSGLSGISTEILPPPVVLDEYFAIPDRDNQTPVIGRLAGDASVPANAVELYARMYESLPGAEFWFMPAPPQLQEAFAGNPRFRFFEPNEISVINFFTACDIYLLTYRDKVPVPGPRSLVEAMAAGCAPVVINRDGPRERIVHGVSGFCADSDDEFCEFVMELATNPERRTTMAAAARKRARTFKVEHWVEKIIQTAFRQHD